MLKTGDGCAVYDRYRQVSFVRPTEFADDIAPMVVVAPGDMVPFVLKLGTHGELLGREAIK